MAGVEALVGAADLGRILARGFSITRTTDGSLVRHIGDIGTGAAIVTTLSDGAVMSRIEDVDPSPSIGENPRHD